MIAKISRGWRIGGLIRYLMGPGRANEHVDPRVVASWDAMPERHQPNLRSDGTLDVDDLATHMADPAVAAGIAQTPPQPGPDGKVPRGIVWHCSLRNSADDPALSDEQWAEIVADLMERTGISRPGDRGRCRWVAVRHADDHVHIAAMLVRQDNGRRVHPRRDYAVTRQVCLDAEARLGLVPTPATDRTAVSTPTRAELEKAQRGAENGATESETSREWLRRMARVAAVQAHDPEAFVAALEDAGVIVRGRTAGGGSDEERNGSTMIGYSVAVPGDVNSTGDPVWFAGGTLASDLSLPALQRRWASAPAPPPVEVEEGPHHARVGPRERAAAIDGAVSEMEHASIELATGEAGTGSGADGIAHAAGDMLAAVQTVSGRRGEGAPGGEAMRRAGDDFDRATRVPLQGMPSQWSPTAASLRQSAWRLGAIRTVGRRGESDAARLARALTTLVAEVVELRLAQSRLAQARAAERSHTELRQAMPAMAGAASPAAPEPGARGPEPTEPSQGASGRSDPRPQPPRSGESTQPRPRPRPVTGPVPATGDGTLRRGRNR